MNERFKFLKTSKWVWAIEWCNCTSAERPTMRAMPVAARRLPSGRWPHSALRSGHRQLRRQRRSRCCYHDAAKLAWTEWYQRGVVQGRWGSTTSFYFFGEIQKNSILAVGKDFDLLVICIWKGLALDNLYDRQGKVRKQREWSWGWLLYGGCGTSIREK